MIVSICKDLTKAKKNTKLKSTVDKGERVISKQRSRIEGSGGGHVHKQKVGLKTYSLTVLSDDAKEALEDIGEFTILTYEEIFGYTRQVVDEDGNLQWGSDILVIEPEHDRPVVTGHEDDLSKPIYDVIRHVEETTREVTDEDGNTSTVAGRDIVTYETTTTQSKDDDGKLLYHQMDVIGTETVPESRYYKPNPVMETIPPVKAATDLYNKAYDRTPITDSEGNIYTPSALFSIPAGALIDHLLAV